jgi:hypothetical protein
MITIKPKQFVVLRKAGKRLCEVSVEPDMVEKLAGYGLAETEIADILGVKEKQFCRVLKKYRVLKDAVEQGRKRASMNVVESLYKKATGFVCEVAIYTKHKGEATAHTASKYYPPDMKAITFWLKNRMPMEWREKIDQQKGTYLVGEKQMQLLTKIAVDRMTELM